MGVADSGVLLRVFLLGWVCVAIAIVAGSSAMADSSSWTDVSSFAYQLQKIDLRAIAATRFDLAIIDYSIDGSEAGRFSSEQIASLKNGEKPKRVLAYLSAGEAEDYRFYWQKAWDADHDGKPDRAAPAWLEKVNPEWKGNYEVRYWDPAWQAIVMQYLDKVIDAGFDGVYLDVIDAFEYWGPEGPSGLNRATAQREMADFVLAIAKHARVDRNRPGFAVFVQSGEALSKFPDYVAAVTGIGREDVFYNGNKPNKPSETAEVVRDLEVFKHAGKLVMVIDYVRKKALIDTFYRKCQELGFVPYATVRPLDALTVNPGHERK